MNHDVIHVVIELLESPHGVGIGLLRITGWPHAPQETTFSIKRNQDGKSLDLQGNWGPGKPLPLSGMKKQEGDVLTGLVGPWIVDSLLASNNAVYRGTLQYGNVQAQATLQVDDKIQGSKARAAGVPNMDRGGELILSEEQLRTLLEHDATTQEQPASQESPEELQRRRQEEEQLRLAEEQRRQEEQRQEEQHRLAEEQRRQEEQGLRKARARRRLFLLGSSLGVVALLAALGGLAWKFDLPGLIKAKLHHQQARQTVSGPCDVAGIQGKSPAGELGFVQGCLGSSPSSQDILKAAETAAAAGRCDAARRLFVHVAQGGDAEAALAYARRFDPQMKVDKQCAGDDPDTAAYWYKIPADAGNVEAQRRLGMLLLQLHASGVEHDEALRYLRQAAAAGDTEAKAALEKAHAQP